MGKNLTSACREWPYFPQCFIAACGLPQECTELPVQDLLQIAPLQLDSLHSSTLYLKHALNQKALANIDVSQHSAGSRPRVKDQTTTAAEGQGSRRKRRRENEEEVVGSIW